MPIADIYIFSNLTIIFNKIFTKPGDANKY